jgi:SAM-dependent methyltransferase
MDDSKRLVADGYDSMHERYVEWGGGDGRRRRQVIGDLLDHELVPPGGDALDLGCGTGALATGHLIRRGLRVTGVDISPRSVEAARSLLPQARFMVEDMSALSFPAESFDLITAFYSIVHVPREEHAGLFGEIAQWLRPGGMLVATLGTRPSIDREPSWLGVPMFWSSWDAESYPVIVEEAGLEILSADIESSLEDSSPVHFLWLQGRRPAPGTPGGHR